MKETFTKKTQLQIYSFIQYDAWTSDATESVRPIDHPTIQGPIQSCMYMPLVKHVDDNTKHPRPVCHDTERIDHCCSQLYSLAQPLSLQFHLSVIDNPQRPAVTFPHIFTLNYQALCSGPSWVLPSNLGSLSLILSAAVRIQSKHPNTNHNIKG